MKLEKYTANFSLKINFAYFWSNTVALTVALRFCVESFLLFAFLCDAVCFCVSVFPARLQYPEKCRSRTHLVPPEQGPAEQVGRHTESVTPLRGVPTAALHSCPCAPESGLASPDPHRVLSPPEGFIKAEQRPPQSPILPQRDRALTGPAEEQRKSRAGGTSLLWTHFSQ